MDTKKKNTSGDYRGEVTRARLMDATLAVIVKEGWGKASTAKICKQAKVSSGAQTHHFPTKTALLIAAVDRLARKYEMDISRRMANLGDEQKPLRTILEGLWEAMLDENYMYSALEAMVAGRTNPELRKPIADLDTEAVNSMQSMAAGIGSSPESVQRVEDAVELSIYLFRGLVIERGIHDDDKFKRRLFDVWCEFIEKALEDDIKPR